MINHTFPCEDLLVLGYPARDFFAARPARQRTAHSFRRWFRRADKAAR